MATVQISKIQLRRGPASDLPGQPSGTPPSFPAGLDDGELGFTTDTGRLFVGQVTPVNGMPNYKRQSYPYQNIEVLTENSPLGAILAPTLGDNQATFLTAVALGNNTGYLQVNDSSGNPETFYLQFSATGVNALVRYFVFDHVGNAIRLGTLSVVWNSTMATPPLCTDEAEVTSGNIADLSWSAVSTGNGVALQYKNDSGNPLQVMFRLDRPVLV